VKTGKLGYGSREGIRWWNVYSSLGGAGNKKETIVVDKIPTMAWLRGAVPVNTM
jgi:hypothetical protein